jgi:hypothetical protein
MAGAENHLDLVAGIVAEEKFFNVSVLAIVRAVCSEGYKAQYKCVHPTKGIDGREIDVQLTVNFGGSSEAGWQVALIMHGIRIHGIDFEESYEDGDGNEQSGWHRHVWCPSVLSSEKNKFPVAGLEEFVSLEIFIYFVSRLMKLKWNRNDDGEMLDLTN